MSLEWNRLASVSSVNRIRTQSVMIDSLGNSVEKVEGPVIGVLDDHGTVVVTYLPTPGTTMITYSHQSRLIYECLQSRCPNSPFQGGLHWARLSLM